MRGFTQKTQFEYQGMTISDLKPNATPTTPDMTLVGKLGVDGSCVGAPSYLHQGRVCDAVVATAILSITLTDYYASVDISNNKIVLRSGVQCPFTARSCMDFEIGETSWVPLLPEQCSVHYFDVLYEGPSSFISTPDVTRKFNDTYVAVQTDNRLFALNKQ